MPTNKRNRHQSTLKIEPLETRELLTFALPFSYMWSESPTSAQPQESYIYGESESYGTITSHRTARGEYQVEFAGKNLGEDKRRGVHVTGYGESSTYCKPTYVGASAEESDLAITVNCFDSNGQPADSRFNASVLHPWGQQGIYFAVADRPTTASYLASKRTARGVTVTMERAATGRYWANFDLLAAPPEGGHVQVTAMGDNPNRCSIDRWSNSSDFRVAVSCIDPHGTLADTPFVVSVVTPAESYDNLGFAWSSDAANSEPVMNVTYAENPADRPISKQRLSTGRYVVQMPGFNPLSEPGGHVQVTSYGDHDKYCKVTHWDMSTSDLSARVSCFDTNGNVADSRFTLLAVPTLEKRIDEFEPNDSAESASRLTGDIRLQANIDNPTDQDFFKWMNVTEAGETLIELSHPSYSGALKFEVWESNQLVGESTHLSAGFHRIVFDSQPGRIYTIHVMGEGHLTTEHYSLYIVSPGDTSRHRKNSPVSFATIGTTVDEEAFIYHNSRNNKSGGDIQIEREGAGVYELTFVRLADDMRHGGSVQVNSVQGDHCKVDNAAAEVTGDLVVRVHCFESHGTFQDSVANVVVIPSDNGGLFAYALADRRTGSYVADVNYAFNPAGAVEITNHEAGLYTVRFRGLGSTSPGGNVQVTSYGGGSSRCNVRGWQSFGDDFTATVQCFTRMGTPTNNEFSIAVIPPNTESDVSYMWSQHDDRNEWPTHPDFSYSPSGETIFKRHVGHGDYVVNFVQASNAMLYDEITLVTAYGEPGNFCTANNTSFASVRCYGTTGYSTNSQFSLLVLPTSRLAAEPDATRDGTVDEHDIGTFCAALHEFPDALFDYNEDGSVDTLDLNHLIRNILGTSFGDANLDGVFNSTDLIQIFAVNEYEDGIDRNSTWSEGDWNCDGEFNSLDLIWAFRDGTYEAAMVASSLGNDDQHALARRKIHDSAIAAILDDETMRQRFHRLGFQ